MGRGRPRKSLENAGIIKKPGQKKSSGNRGRPKGTTKIAKEQKDDLPKFNPNTVPETVVGYAKIDGKKEPLFAMQQVKSKDAYIHPDNLWIVTYRNSHEYLQSVFLYENEISRK